MGRSTEIQLKKPQAGSSSTAALKLGSGERSEVNRVLDQSPRVPTLIEKIRRVQKFLTSISLIPECFLDSR